MSLSILPPGDLDPSFMIDHASAVFNDEMLDELLQERGIVPTLGDKYHKMALLTLFKFGKIFPSGHYEDQKLLQDVQRWWSMTFHQLYFEAQHIGLTPLSLKFKVVEQMVTHRLYTINHGLLVQAQLQQYEQQQDSETELSDFPSPNTRI